MARARELLGNKAASFAIQLEDTLGVERLDKSAAFDFSAACSTLRHTSSTPSSSTTSISTISPAIRCSNAIGTTCAWTATLSRS